MPNSQDVDRHRQIDDPATREQIADMRKRRAHGKHIDPDAPVPHNPTEFVELFFDALEARDRAQKEERAMNTPEPVKKVFDWTFNPQFFLMAGLAVASFVGTLTVWQFQIREDIRNQGARLDRAMDLMATIQTEVGNNKAEVDKRALTYVPMIESLKSSQGIQDTRLQNMIESNSDFRKFVTESIGEMNKAVKEASTNIAALTTEIAVEKVRSGAEPPLVPGLAPRRDGRSGNSN